MAMKYACKLNGCTQVALMKLDVLDGFDEVKVCVGYEYRGERIEYIPYDYENARPIYQSFKGGEKTEGIREFEKLPQNCKEYIRALEKMIECKISILSTSPDREDSIRL